MVNKPLEKSNLNIAMITPWKVKCGIYTYANNLINAMKEYNVNIYVIRLPRFGIKTHDILRAVIESIPLNKIDLIHIQHEYGLYQSLDEGFLAGLKQLGKPIVTTMHAVGNWEIDLSINDASDRVIVHNKFCAKGYQHPCVTIPHGVKKGEIKPREESKVSYAIPKDAQTVGYCGFISKYKGLETLIEAMVKVPKAALIIGGGWHAGPGTDYILQLRQRSLQKLAGRCQWLDWIPEEQLATAYGAMDIVVYPSRWATESGALLMALGHGKAIIATRIAPFKEKEKVGALQTFKNVKDLTRKIKKLLKDKTYRQKFEAGAKKYTEENSWSKVAKKHVDLYRTLIDKPRKQNLN